MKLLSSISIAYEFSDRLLDRLLRESSKHRFAECGRNVRFHPLSSQFTFDHIHIGNDVQIGPNACLIASKAHVHIGNKVLFGPHVTIRGGNHRFDIVGRFIHDIGDDEKRKSDDQDVWIEDDVWIGTNVTILKGVTIGKGSVIAAGAVVTQTIPPYSIAGGVPAKVIRARFTSEQIKEHENILYGGN